MIITIAPVKRKDGSIEAGGEFSWEVQALEEHLAELGDQRIANVLNTAIPRAIRNRIRNQMAKPGVTFEDALGEYKSGVWLPGDKKKASSKPVTAERMMEQFEGMDEDQAAQYQKMLAQKLTAKKRKAK